MFRETSLYGIITAQIIELIYILIHYWKIEIQ